MSSSSQQSLHSSTETSKTDYVLPLHDDSNNIEQIPGISNKTLEMLVDESSTSPLYNIPKVVRNEGYLQNTLSHPVGLSSLPTFNPSSESQINIVNFHHHFQSPSSTSKDTKSTCEGGIYLPVTVSNKKIDAPLSSTVPEFLYQLTKMLTDDNKEVIEWANGKIDVHNPPKLASDILHKYFRHSKYASFQRQLNNFCFRKLAGKGKMSPCSYINENATSDIRSLLTIKRKKTSIPHADKSTKKRKMLNSDRSSNQNSMTGNKFRGGVNEFCRDSVIRSTSATSAVGKGVKHCFNGFLRDNQLNLSQIPPIIASSVESNSGAIIQQVNGINDEKTGTGTVANLSPNTIPITNVVSNPNSISTACANMVNSSGMVADTTTWSCTNSSSESLSTSGTILFNKKGWSLNSKTDHEHFGDKSCHDSSREDANKSPVLVSSGNSSEVLASNTDPSDANHEVVASTTLNKSFKSSSSLVDLAYIPTLTANVEVDRPDDPDNLMTFIDFPHEYNTTQDGFDFDPS